MSHKQPSKGCRILNLIRALPPCERPPAGAVICECRPVMRMPALDPVVSPAQPRLNPSTNRAGHCLENSQRASGRCIKCSCWGSIFYYCLFFFFIFIHLAAGHISYYGADVVLAVCWQFYLCVRDY